jgi:hypothetical protein
MIGPTTVSRREGEALIAARKRTPTLPPEVVETWERHANAAIDNASRTANVTSREPPFSV